MRASDQVQPASAGYGRDGPGFPRQSDGRDQGPETYGQQFGNLIKNPGLHCHILNLFQPSPHDSFAKLRWIGGEGTRGQITNSQGCLSTLQSLAVLFQICISSAEDRPARALFKFVMNIISFWRILSSNGQHGVSTNVARVHLCSNRKGRRNRARKCVPR